MKVSIIPLLICVCFASLQAQKTIGPFTFHQNNISCSVVAEIQIQGEPLSPSDIIAAFDSDGSCAGASALIENPDGATFANLAIYGDESLTGEIDEGLIETEDFTFKLFLASTEEIIDYKVDNEIISFSGWKNLNGAPLPKFEYEDYKILNFTVQNTNLPDNSIDEFKIQNVLPIPATNYINIVFNSNFNEKITYSIFDVSGKLITSQIKDSLIGSNNLKLNIEHFTPGTYFIKIHGNHQGNTMSKFIKN